MKSVIIRKAGKKGKGLFANRDFKKGEKIMHVDLTRLKSFTKKEMDKNPKLQSEHCDYVGNDRYVISFHPYSYINHSCNPNILVKHKTIAISDFFALKNIKKGEEITVDYGVNAMDQFGKTRWIMKCHCGSKNCRKKIPGDFFKQPIKIQRFYWKYLPISIKRKFRRRFERLR